MLRIKAPGPYEDLVGPTVLAVILMVAIAAQFSLKLYHMMLKVAWLLQLQVVLNLKSCQKDQEIKEYIIFVTFRNRMLSLQSP